MSIFETISSQQKGKEDTTVWMVGEQLKDMCRADPSCIPILEADMKNAGMGIEAAERKIKAHADKLHKQHKGNVGISSHTAEKILREFYGLPDAHAQPVMAPAPSAPDILDLDDFLGD